MSKIEDALRKLTPEQRALLELRLKKKRASESTGSNRIEVRPDVSVFPISAGQRRLLALEQLTPGTPKYNLTFAHRLMGALNVEALQHSVLRVLERHQILLGRFPYEEGSWNQYRGELPESPLELISLSKLPAPNRLKQAIALAHKQSKHPFNLEQGPLCRNALIRLAPNDHILIVSMHHIVSDAWSFDLYFNELSSFYQNQTADQALDVPTLSIDYSDYALWQEGWLKGPDAKKQLDYWESLFPSPPKATVLPVDKHPASRHSTEGGFTSTIVPEDVTEKLKEISLEFKLTPFVLFLAAYNTLLYQYSRQKEILICAPVMSRRRLEIESLIGYFNNILLLKAQPSDAQTFTGLAKDISNYTVSVSDNQDIPFETIAGLPSLRQTPLTRAFFTFQDGIGTNFTLPDIEIESINLPSPGADFDLALFVEQHVEGLVLSLEYKTQLFSSEQVQSILKNYVEILTRAAENPGINLGDLPSYELPKRPAPPEPVEQEEPLASSNGAIANRHTDSKSSVPAKKLEILPSSKPDSQAQQVDAPPDHIEEILTRIWERLLGKNNISIHDSFFEIGGHSLMAVHMFAEIQKYISSFSLPLAVLLEAPTISSLAQRIRNKKDSDWSPVAIIQPGRKSIPIFCIHGAGGNVLIYRDLAIQLGPDQTVYGLQSQGMDGNRPALSSIEEMATLYVNAIRDTYPQGPYLLLGYCMGGTLAFEIAQQLTKQGQKVELVAMLETYNWIKEPKPSFFSKLRNKFQQIEFHIRNYFLLSRKERRMFISEKWATLHRRRKVWNGRLQAKFRPKKLAERTQEGVNPRALAQVWKTNDQAAEKYKPSKYPGRIISYLPLKEYKDHVHPGMDWKDLAREVDTQILSVYPAGMLIQPFVKELAQSIRAEIYRITKDYNTNDSSISLRTNRNGKKQLPSKTSNPQVTGQEPEISS